MYPSIEIENALQEMDPICFEAIINDIVRYIYKNETILNIKKIGMSHG